jgi:hypothetical protein
MKISWRKHQLAKTQAKIMAAKRESENIYQWRRSDRSISSQQLAAMWHQAKRGGGSVAGNQSAGGVAARKAAAAAIISISGGGWATWRPPA